MIDKKADAQLPFVPGLCACRFSVLLPLQLWHRYSRTGVIFKFIRTKLISAPIPGSQAFVFVICPLSSDVGTVQSQPQSAARKQIGRAHV